MNGDVYSGTLIRDLSATVDRALTPPQARSTEEDLLKAYQKLSNERDRAAYGVVGSIIGLLGNAEISELSGIPLDDVKRILEPYHQADAALKAHVWSQAK